MIELVGVVVGELERVFVEEMLEEAPTVIKLVGVFVGELERVLVELVEAEAPRVIELVGVGVCVGEKGEELEMVKIGSAPEEERDGVALPVLPVPEAEREGEAAGVGGGCRC